MKISTMRLVDHWLGRPICFFMTGLRRCGDLFGLPQQPSSKKIKKILFIKLAEQGATVLAEGALRRAAEIVGRENVYFMVLEQNRFILDVMDLIPQQNIISIPDKSFISFTFGAIRALRKVRRLGIDASIDLEFFARSSAILSYLSGASIRVGLHGFFGGGPYRGDLMTHRLNYNPHLHTSRMFEAMTEAINLPPEDMPMMDLTLSMPNSFESHFTPSDKELKEFKAVLESQAGTSKYSPLILLNANSSDMLPLRRWPSERYVKLARRLIEKSPEVHVAFTGSPYEAKHSQKLVSEVDSKRCFSMTGRTNMRELMLLYCLSDLLVTNDSGPALFATLTNIQVVTLFGPETPLLFGSNSPRSTIIWKNIPCSPCVSAYNNRQSACRNNVCMQRISVDEVFELVCRLCRI